jgi:hypothetical protein
MTEMNSRVSWFELPTALRERIESEAGQFIQEKQLLTGHNCLVGMVLTTSRDTYFLKGVPADHARAVWTQANEAAINPAVEAVTPSLRFHVQAEGWDILGFQYLAHHRHADLSPGSPDLPYVAQTLRVLSTCRAPETVTLRKIEDRWHDYLGARADLLAGSTVAHTDIHRHNIMIGSSAKLVDWAWPTLAAPWLDTACVGLQLIEAGHQPEDAERWCQQSTAYAAASTDAVSAFVSGACAMWLDISAADRQPWKFDVAAAAERWAKHRGL